jgi:hypothetical protein
MAGSAVLVKDGGDVAIEGLCGGWHDEQRRHEETEQILLLESG